MKLKEPVKINTDANTFYRFLFVNVLKLRYDSNSGVK